MGFVPSKSGRARDILSAVQSFGSNVNVIRLLLTDQSSFLRPGAKMSNGVRWEHVPDISRIPKVPGVPGVPKPRSPPRHLLGFPAS